jgi:uncharacterized protein with HEPN domain
MWRDAAWLFDILKACRRICEYVSEIEKEKFIKDHMCQDAVVRQMEIIGEATKRLSDDLCQSNPEIPWAKMARLRDKLIHAYNHLNINIVWSIAKEDVPTLIPQIEFLLDSINDK